MGKDGSERRLYRAKSVRELDALAIDSLKVPGLVLMRRAANACVETLQARWPAADSIAVFCGSGNNAGDGYIIAGMLAERSKQVQVYVVGDPEKLGPDAREASAYCRTTRATFIDWAGQTAASVDVVVDALLGTGLSGPVRPEYLEAIAAINQLGAPVLAVDIPSGLSADTGVRMGASVRADVTVTFIGVKQGLVTMDGPDAAGEVVFADLEVDHQIYDRVAADADVLWLPSLMAALPRRPRNAHKNQFGHVLVIGGDAGMGGAVVMSAEAALRTGAGLVSVATHPAHAAALLVRRPELMVTGILDEAELMPLLARASVIVLGPGLGRTAWSNRVWKRVMEETADGTQLVVLDADGLNLLALAPVRRDNWILTPHPGEASNLLQDNRIQQDRFRAIEQLQQKYGGVALLKGVGTIVYDGHSLSVCTDGNPGMSSAGMGDVLSGVIGGLAAQGLEAPAATRLGVLVHAMAGDCAAADGERGLIATDLLPHIRRLLNTVIS